MGFIVSWRGFNIEGRFKDLSHLRSNTITTEISGQAISLNVSYGSHCFTDEKENGPPVLPGRYWSEERYNRSFDLPDFIENNFTLSFAVPYFNKNKNGEQYHYMEAFDYVIFFEITKPYNSANTLNIKIISAYELDQWGSVPKGKPYKVRWILSERLAGNSILKRKKNNR